jgi:hypothetical protein
LAEGSDLRFKMLTDALVAAPSLNLTPEEKRVFGQLFRQADTEGLGVVTGEVAVKFFEKTRLEPRVLGEVCISLLRPRCSTGPLLSILILTYPAL